MANAHELMTERNCRGRAPGDNSDLVKVAPDAPLETRFISVLYPFNCAIDLDGGVQ
jgi:hypothetical protein